MTFSKLQWLKRTNGHKFTGSELRVLLSIYNHSDADGRRSHPGIELMEQETGYRKSGISEAATALKQRGWIHETYRGNGRARQSSVFELVPDAPDPAYRCSDGRCSACSNGSGVAEPLSVSNGSAVAEVLGVHGSGVVLNGSATAGPIVPLERLPTDPVSDPRTDPVDAWGRQSDPGQVRDSPNHRDFIEPGSRSLDATEEKDINHIYDPYSEPPKGSEDQPNSITESKNEPTPAGFGSPYPMDDPWASSPSPSN
jgi:hypothetical protein